MPSARSRGGIALAAAVLSLAPAALAFLYVRMFGVNVPFWDEWEFVPYYQLFYTHELRLADLFALHNEHRIFFPRLIMLGLGNAFDGNPVSWMYASVVLLCAAGAVLFAQHRKLLGAGALASFVPIAWILFSLRQAQNLLWGFQVQIVLCVAALVTGTALLREGRWGRFWLAAACGFVASFSFAAGLLFWPALFVLLAVRRLRERVPAAMLAVWAVLSVAAWVLYLHGYVRPVHKVPAAWPFQHPLSTLYIGLGTLGGCLSGDVRGSAAAGGALLLLAALIAFAALRRGIDWTRAQPALPLLIFGLGAAAMVAMGRAGFNSQGVSNASRFTTMTLLAVIGLYQCLLALTDARLRKTASGVFAAVFVLGLFGSLDGAFERGEEYRAAREHDVALLRDLAHHRDGELVTLFWRPADVRQRAQILARYKLSVFAE